MSNFYKLEDCHFNLKQAAENKHRKYCEKNKKANHSLNLNKETQSLLSFKIKRIISQNNSYKTFLQNRLKDRASVLSQNRARAQKIMDSIYITTSPSVTMHSDLLSKLSFLNTVHENRKKLTNSMNAENEKLEQNINKCKAELESFVIVPPQTYITKLVCLVLDIQKKQLKMKTFRNKIKATTISSANINTNKLQPKGKLAHRSFCLLNPFLRSTPHPVAIPTLKPSVVESKTFDNAEKIIKSPTNRKQLILSRKPEDAVKKDTIDEISKFKKPKRNKVVEFVDSTTPKLIGKKDFNLCSPSEGFTFQMRSMFSSDSEKLEDISLGSKDSFLLRPFNYEPKSQENFFNLSLNNNLELLF